MTVTRFPHLAQANPDGNFVGSIVAVEAALKEGSIANVAYNEHKQVLNEAIGRSWESNVLTHYLSVSSEGHECQLAFELYMSGSRNLHAVLSLGKKLTKAEKGGLGAGHFGDFFKAATSFHDELIGLAISFKELKSCIVKGRPAGIKVKASSVNPNQLRGACSFCFKSHAVVGGTIAHHGYRLPVAGFKTDECIGSGLVPYETSPKGVEKVLDILDKTIENKSFRLASKEDWGMVFLPVKIGRRTTTKAISRFDSEWEAAKEQEIKRLNADIASLKEKRPFFEDKLNSWEAKPLKKG